MSKAMRRSRTLGAVVALALCWLPLSAADLVPANQALLVVRLPAHASLIIAETMTRQKGTERVFVSPPLVPGKDYYYVVKATWNEGGQPRIVSREVVVRAGQRSEVDLHVAEPVTRAPRTEVKPAQPKSRTFLFTYRTTILDLPQDQTARVWLPVAVSNDYQEVKMEDDKGLPAGYRIDKEPLYGNSILYAEVKGDKDGRATLAVTYRITRKEVKGPSKPAIPDANLLQRYLEPDKLVPVAGKPLELIRDLPLPSDQMKLAKKLYDLVNKHMKYSKQGTGWGRGDAVWACDSKFGNCSDFHSLFISLARSQKIPAKFEMGFPLPTQRGQGEIGGYHCWAFFKPEGQGWVPVDISEANKEPKLTDYYFGNLTEDRVQFTTGRDFDLVPKQKGEPLNYFIYPYVEVDGKVYAADKVQRKFTYQDVP